VPAPYKVIVFAQDNYTFIIEYFIYNPSIEYCTFVAPEQRISQYFDSKKKNKAFLLI